MATSCTCTCICVNRIKTKRIRVECASQKCPFSVVIKQQQVFSFPTVFLFCFCLKTILLLLLWLISMRLIYVPAALTIAFTAGNAVVLVV